MSEKFKSLVYPIKGKINFSVKILDDWRNNQKHSDPVRIGICEWGLILKIEEGRLKGVLENIDYCCFNDEFITVTFRIQILNENSENLKFGFEKLKIKESPEFLDLCSIEDLKNGGFVNFENGKIEILCEISILEEHYPRRLISMASRPNTVDFKNIYRRDYYKREREIIFEELMENLEDMESDGREIFLPVFFIDGVPFQASISANSQDPDYYSVKLYCNHLEPNDWWGTVISVEWKNLEESVYFGNQWRIEMSFINGCTQPTKILKREILENQENGKKKLKFKGSVILWRRWVFDLYSRDGDDRKYDLMSDVTLEVDGWFIDSCKMILSFHSPYFHRLFSKNPEKSDFFIENCSISEFRQFIFLAHNCDVIIDDVERLLNLLKRFEAFECIRRLNLTTDSENSEVSESESETLNFSEKNKFSDVELEVDGKKFHVSKQILSNSSVFFMKHFYRRYRKMKNEKLPETSAENFEILLKFIYYPSHLKIDDKNYGILLEMGDKFQVDRLMDEVEKFLILSQNLELEEKKRMAEKYEEMVYLKSFCENQER